MRNFTPTAQETNTYVVREGATNQETMIIRVEGKKRELKRLGLPTDLRRATPAESRWGKELDIFSARAYLNGEAFLNES